MNRQFLDKNGKLKEVVISIEDYNNLLKEIEYYKKTIEELQDELDAYESEQIKKGVYETVKFDIKDYVSDRNRKVSSKNIKKSSRKRTNKSSKSYSGSGN